MSLIPMKVRHEVKAMATGRVFEFYITDDVQPDGTRFNWDTYSWERVESTTSQRYFVDNLKDTKEGDTVNLYINSMGGSVKVAPCAGPLPLWWPILTVLPLPLRPSLLWRPAR